MRCTRNADDGRKGKWADCKYFFIWWSPLYIQRSIWNRKICGNTKPTITTLKHSCCPYFEESFFMFFLLCWDSVRGVSKELEILVEQLSLDWLSVLSVLGWGGRRNAPTQQNGLSLSRHTLSVRIKASTCCFYWTVNTILLFALCWRR